MFSNNQVFALIGKNGCGKSNFLARVVNQIIESKNHEMPAFHGYVRESFFKNVISVSTTPFDKFPVKYISNKGFDYSYLGIKGLPTLNLSSSYIDRVGLDILKSGKINSRKVYSNVLGYLGYDEFMQLEFESNLSKSDLIRIIKEQRANGWREFIEEFYRVIRGRKNIKHVVENFLMKDGAKNVDNLNAAISAIMRFHDIAADGKLSITVNDDDIDIPEYRSGNELSGIKGFDLSSRDDIDLIVDCVRFNLVRVKNVYLFKGSDFFSIKNASSGEQTMILTFLAVANRIKNNSLILIDEPETNLHPEWQEKYIEFMMNSFSSYEGCVYLIATHSPQILASISGVENYIVQMEVDDNDFLFNDGKYIVDAEKFHKKSIDYQLAVGFKKPGFKNEYMSRVLIAAIAEFSKTGEFRPETISEVKPLLELRDKLNPDDPTIQLVDIVAEALEDFSNDS